MNGESYVSRRLIFTRYSAVPIAHIALAVVADLCDSIGVNCPNCPHRT